jgi:hypothetical protein
MLFEYHHSCFNDLCQYENELDVIQMFNELSFKTPSEVINLLMDAAKERCRKNGTTIDRCIQNRRKRETNSQQLTCGYLENGCNALFLDDISTNAGSVL